jgi:hypothetical protein
VLPATALAMLHAAGAVLEQPWNTSVKTIQDRRFTTDSAGNYSTRVLISHDFADNRVEYRSSHKAVRTPATSTRGTRNGVLQPR